jgi:predicted adenylyl cyclase CyaB
MKEIEVLVKVEDDINLVKKVFERFNYIGDNKTIDTYYYDPLRSNLKPNDKNQIDECMRIRTKNDKCYISYKVDHFDKDKWIYSDEYETEVYSYEQIVKIISLLGLKELLKIVNTKMTYTYQDYEIVLEFVEDLGTFMEVEYCTEDDVDINLIKSEIKEFINSLNIKVSDELNMGKPEMMINYQKNRLPK